MTGNVRAEAMVTTDEKQEGHASGRLCGHIPNSPRAASHIRKLLFFHHERVNCRNTPELLEMLVMSSCVRHSHHHQLRLPHRPAGPGRLGGARLAAASFVPPLRRQGSALRARAMSAEAPLGVAPAEPGAPATAAVLSEMAEDAAVWCAVNGLVVGDRDNPVCQLATLP